jgi:hypothetical protein
MQFAADVPCRRRIRQQFRVQPSGRRADDLGEGFAPVSAAFRLLKHCRTRAKEGE